MFGDFLLLLHLLDVVSLATVVVCLLLDRNVSVIGLMRAKYVDVERGSENMT